MKDVLTRLCLVEGSFHSTWEARLVAIVEAMQRRNVLAWSDLAEVLPSAGGWDEQRFFSLLERLEQLLVARGVVAGGELETRNEHFQASVEHHDDADHHDHDHEH